MQRFLSSPHIAGLKTDSTIEMVVFERWLMADHILIAYGANHMLISSFELQINVAMAPDKRADEVSGTLYREIRLISQQRVYRFKSKYWNLLH